MLRKRQSIASSQAVPPHPEVEENEDPFVAEESEKLLKPEKLSEDTSSDSSLVVEAAIAADQRNPMLELEDVVLEKLEVFLKRVEERMSNWEEYSAAAVDQKIESAMQALSHIKDNVLQEQRQRAEAFAKVLEQHFAEVVPSRETVSHHVSDGIKHFEDLLHKLEDSYASHTIQTALRLASTGLLTRDQLPDDWKDNPYIIRGYRFCQNPYECITSAVHLHNETTNIWTHIAAFFIVIGLAFFHLPSTSTWQSLSWVDKAPLILFIIAALKCLVCSVTWHTFCNIAHLKVKKRMSCVDYTGITALITASIMTTVHAALYCHPWARTFYMTLTAIFGIAGVCFTWTPSFDSSDSRATRVLFFSSFALSGAAAGFHAMLYRSPIELLKFYLPVIRSLLCYGLGIIFYAFLIPERWMPGSIFDYIGMSHNLWHLCVFGGIYYHYQATMLLMEEATSLACT